MFACWQLFTDQLELLTAIQFPPNQLLLRRLRGEHCSHPAPRLDFSVQCRQQRCERIVRKHL